MADLSGIGSGVASGSSFGLGVGGPIGAGIGGIVGGLSSLFGGGKKKKKVSTFDKRQKKLNKQQYEALMGKGPLADLYKYDPAKANEVFDKTIGAAAYKEHNEQTIPGITGSFRKEGLANSSYTADALAKSGADVANKLSGQRTKYLYDEQNNARDARRNAIENLQNRQAFQWDNSPGGGFDLDSILGKLSPQMMEIIKKRFKG